MASRVALRVAIVGAGWAGLACAIAAAEAGTQVDVYERCTRPADAPLPIDVTPDMLRCLDRLGVAEVCVRGGFPYRSVTVTDGAGRLRDEIPCVRLAGSRLPVAVGLHGAVLGDALTAEALRRGVRIHRAAEVEAISYDDDDRAELRVCGHGIVGADLTLLATGGDAPCRGAPFGLREGAVDDDAPAALATDTATAAVTAAVTPASRQVTWWCGVVQRPPGLDQPQFVLAGLRSKLWLAPLSGVAAGVSLIGDDLQALTAPTLSAAQVRTWLQRHGCHADLVSLMSDDSVLMRPVRVCAGVRPLPWHRGNLLCVGAAAHGLPPHFSQPAAQAFEDAVVLGELLEACPATPAELPALLRAFEHRRQPRVEAVFDVSARAMQWDRDPHSGAGLNALAASMAAVLAAPA